VNGASFGLKLLPLEPTQASEAMLRFFAIVVVCLALSLHCYGVDVAEANAISAIGHAFPYLYRVPSYSLYNEHLLEFGNSWNNDLAQVCVGGAGYHFFGLHCDEFGHIDKIRLYVPSLQSICLSILQFQMND
jgi:hypothetical protein